MHGYFFDNIWASIVAAELMASLVGGFFSLQQHCGKMSGQLKAAAGRLMDMNTIPETAKPLQQSQGFCCCSEDGKQAAMASWAEGAQDAGGAAWNMT